MNTQPSNYKNKKKHTIKSTKRKNHEEFMKAMNRLSGSIDDPTFAEPPEIKHESPREQIV